MQNATNSNSNNNAETTIADSFKTLHEILQTFAKSGGLVEVLKEMKTLSETQRVQLFIIHADLVKDKDMPVAILDLIRCRIIQLWVMEHKSKEIPYNLYKGMEFIQDSFKEKKLRDTYGAIGLDLLTQHIAELNY